MALYLIACVWLSIGHGSSSCRDPCGLDAATACDGGWQAHRSSCSRALATRERDRSAARTPPTIFDRHCGVPVEIASAGSSA